MYELQSLEIYQHTNFPFQNPWRLSINVNNYMHVKEQIFKDELLKTVHLVLAECVATSHRRSFLKTITRQDISLFVMIFV